MAELQEQVLLNFNKYPDVGPEDWGYTFAVARIRALEPNMLTRAMLLDMTNAEDFKAAADLLSSTQYALSQAKDFSEVEPILKQLRTEVRAIFKELIVDDEIGELFRAREDFTNMRLALRRKLTGRPVGTDYSEQGSIPAEQFEQLFEEEDYSTLPACIRDAIEKAVLAYYQNKDVRQIDYAIDSYEAEHNLNVAKKIGNEFLIQMFRMRIDLTNIRTMLRLKFTESREQSVFLEGGYVAISRFKHGLDVNFEGVVPMFMATPYGEIVELGVSYFTANRSFLKLEECCEDHMIGFLKTTSQITAGAQPVIAYLLRKENEIRKVRLILTAKKNGLDTGLILDRLGE